MFFFPETKSHSVVQVKFEFILFSCLSFLSCWNYRCNHHAWLGSKLSRIEQQLGRLGCHYPAGWVIKFYGATLCVLQTTM